MILSSDFWIETITYFLVIVGNMAPFWLSIAFGFIAFETWIYYKRSQFLKKQVYKLLEIKLPVEIQKSPLAMEIVLGAFHQTVGESTWYDRIVLGKMRARFSLEIVSIEGDVKFFIRTNTFNQKFIESQIYSQYPAAEIYEVPDYTDRIKYAREGSDWNLFGVEFKLNKKDPYPIKTYIDYETDATLHEEQKIDPITPMLEFMGAIGKNEQVWFQILVRSNIGGKDPTTLWKDRDWHEEGKELIENILDKASKRSGVIQYEPGQEMPMQILTDGERNTIKAIERNISKLGFDCGIRAIYIAKKDSFNPVNIAGLFGTVKQYNSNDLNGFKPSLYTDIDYPWQKYLKIGKEVYFYPGGTRIEHIKWKIFDAYRRRGWFFPPYERKPFVLNTEELATIFHFPGRVAETPTFGRVESKKSEPPVNLPK